MPTFECPGDNQVCATDYDFEDHKTADDMIGLFRRHWEAGEAEGADEETFVNMTTSWHESVLWPCRCRPSIPERNEFIQRIREELREKDW